jgi:pilus assembly protein CpaE
VNATRSAAAADHVREGVLAVLQDQVVLDRIHGVIRDQRLTDEVAVEGTLDAALRRIRSGPPPRILLLDLAESTAPIAEVSAARSVGGAELKLVALGNINDVTLFRELISAGANDYLVKPPSRETLVTVLEKGSHAKTAGGGDGLGQVIVFVGSRGGVGTTTAAVSCAWLLAEERQERTALVDFDLHFGTVGLMLDTDPGNGLCEALEEPSRVDSLFIERALVKVTDNLRVLAAEATAAEPLTVDPGAADLLLHELRRKFAWVVVDLPRTASAVQRAVLTSASRAVLVCERSLAGLRDTIRLQTLARDQAPQATLFLVEAGATGERAVVGKSGFEKGIGKALDAVISYDAKSVGTALNAGQPLPMAAPRSPVVRELRQLVASLTGAAPAAPKRRMFALRSIW